MDVLKSICPVFLHKLDEFDKKIKLDKKLIDKNEILTRKKT